MAGFAMFVLALIFWIAMFVFSGPLAVALLAVFFIVVIKAWTTKEVEVSETTTGSETHN
jgi:hypothetical protein